MTFEQPENNIAMAKNTAPSACDAKHPDAAPLKSPLRYPGGKNRVAPSPYAIVAYEP